MKNNVVLLDLFISRNSYKGLAIGISEARRVKDVVGFAAYYVYSIYRTYPFQCLADITDANVGRLVGMEESAVKKHRRTLEKEGLMLRINNGKRPDGVVTKTYLIGDIEVAMYRAGYGDKVTSYTNLFSVTKGMNLNTVQDVKDRIHEIMALYSLKCSR